MLHGDVLPQVRGICWDAEAQWGMFTNAPFTETQGDVSQEMGDISLLWETLGKHPFKKGGSWPLDLENMKCLEQKMCIYIMLSLAMFMTCYCFLYI